MNWLDPQTKELLQKVPDTKLAPPKTAEFALVLLRKGKDHERLIHAIAQINKCRASKATVLASRRVPVTINNDLTEEEALWGQFELICCDAISVFVRSEVMQANDGFYLVPLFQQVLRSPEFRPFKINLIKVPVNESGKKYLDKFLGETTKPIFPIALKVPFKKARIMEHWAKRVGAQIQLETIQNE